MTGNAKNLRDVLEISSCHVALPYGNNAVAIKEGSVILGGNLILKDVLYVPGLTCNLIYVSQLIDHSDCFVQFTNSLCVIHGRTSRMLIGAGERRDGLYYFRAIPSIKAMKVHGASSLDLWHKRLGHPSLQVTKLVPVVDLKKSSGILNKSCDRGSEDAQNVQEQPVSSAEQNVADLIAQEVRPDDEGDMEEQFGCGHRRQQASVRLRDYVTNTIRLLSPLVHSPTPQHLSGTPYPIAHYANCDKFSLRRRTFLATINADHEPTTFSEAMKDKRWREAMQREIQALENYETWEIEDLPLGKKNLGCKWVYKIKYNSDGTVERNKALLVIFGNHEIEGIDYTDTFAPVAKMVTVRAFLAVAASKKWELHKMDVHNAFLHGDLQEEVYMKLPPGFRVTIPGKVCRLRKSLYGLKQAPRCWFAKLSAALKEYGFQQSYSDYSLFTLQRGVVQVNVLVYVDDLIIFGNNHAAIQRFKTYLSECFHMKDLGALKYFLRVEVTRGPEGIFLCQRKYSIDIISEVGLLGAKLASVPLEQNHWLALATGRLIDDPERFRRLVGHLIYLCFTRPELSYCVHALSQFMQQLREEHWEAALRVVRYLKGNPGQGILLSNECNLRLHGWCDADWSGCPLTRRSLTGWIIFLGTSPISWKTKKQHTMSRSSVEAEYRSMAMTTGELLWLKGILQSLGVSHNFAMHLSCDSQAALHIAKNPVFHERTKNIEMDCHFVRDEIIKDNIHPQFVPSHAQLADIFTKTLGESQFDNFTRKLGIRNLHAPTLGGVLDINIDM
ncbi:hypothetical protein RJ640_009315 [Escallonia rubra]|uniref:Reverse transcriptase Ty1/copia-type domain-containing protein n=1 Tax=Escallonia rubra TaxID=112253 RepID=A0AA88QTK9_9ASTE|nr:hypothetical protein RJ640_009315 [Escallonia rubra]